MYRNADEEAEIGPFDPAIYNAGSVVGLCGDYRMGASTWKEQRRYDSPQYQRHMDAFSVRLSSRFGVRRIAEFKKCDGDPIPVLCTCRLSCARSNCNSGAKNLLR